MGQKKQQPARLMECPYLINAWRSSISCSGIVKGSSTLLRFESGEEAKKWQYAFCKRVDKCGYYNCPYYQLLSELGC